MDFTPIIKKDNTKYTFKQYLLSFNALIPLLWILSINIFSLCIIIIFPMDLIVILSVEIFLILVLIATIKGILNHWTHLKYLNEHDKY